MLDGDVELGGFGGRPLHSGWAGHVSGCALWPSGHHHFCSVIKCSLFTFSSFFFLERKITCTPSGRIECPSESLAQSPSVGFGIRLVSRSPLVQGVVGTANKPDYSSEWSLR